MGEDCYSDGKLESGKVHGSGKLKFADGCTYVRRVVGNMHLQVMIKFANGDLYEGEWMDDSMHNKKGTLWKMANVDTRVDG